MPNITARPAAIDRRALQPLPSSSIDASVQDLYEALRRELVPTSAIERTAIDEYIQVECQRHRLRQMRDQIERNYAMGHVCTLLARAMVQANNRDGVEEAGVDRKAEQIVRHWIAGDSEACAELMLYGIDIDEAISMGVAAQLPQLVEFDRERDRLAKRARLLLEDIERTQKFRGRRTVVDIQEAEIIN